MNNVSTSPGIYLIRNLHNQKIYIGQTNNLSKRFRRHLKDLNLGIHHNSYLQRDFNKCKEITGDASFIKFEVIEELVDSTKEERNQKEQAEILKHFDNCNQCYNIRENDNSSLRGCGSYTPEETKQKQSESAKRVWESKAHKELIKSKIKEKWQNIEFKQKNAQAIKQGWLSKLTKVRAVLVSPDGVEHKVFCVRDFTKTNGLNRTSINNLIKGKSKNYKGWTIKST